jgi:hypothetical protein
MVLTRLLPLQRLEALNLPRSVLQTTTYCTLCAIDRQQWANFAWRLADVLEPLARLSLCPAYRSVLCDCGATFQILRAVAATRRHSGEDGALERLHHCLVALCLLSHIPAAREEVLLNGEITASDLLWNDSTSVAGSPAESLLDRDSSDLWTVAVEEDMAHGMGVGIEEGVGGGKGRGEGGAEWGLTGSPRNLSALQLLDGKHSQKSSM